MDIPKLRSTFKGRLLAPGDDEYDAIRTVFYGGIDKHPAVIIRVANAQDVSKAVLLAKETGLELAVRSGGHSFAGHCTTEGGIVIDLRDMKHLEVDTAKQTAWAETGLTASEVTTQLDIHNMAVGFGDTGSVGIGGITLGGGVGFLVRKYGMTIDNLLAAEVVTANGEIVHTDANTHPDLFWAIRGGGGNFGIATKFQFALHTIDSAIGGMLILPATAETITQCMQLATKAPDELSAIFNIMPSPPMPMVPPEYHGKLIIMALLMCVGDIKTGESIVAPFRTCTTPIADMIHPMRYKEIFFPDQEDYHPTAVAQTMFMKHVDKPTAENIIERLNAIQAPMKVVQLRTLGGAMARVQNDATAFAHRKSAIMANVAAFYETSEEKTQRHQWVHKTSQSLYQGDHGAYVNFLGEGDEGRIRDAYPEQTWKKLSDIKKRYDPTNIFHLNCNVLP